MSAFSGGSRVRCARPRVLLALALLLGALTVLMFAWSGSAFAAAGSRVVLRAPRVASAGGLATFSGRVSKVQAGSGLVVQRRARTDWVVIASGRVGKRGRFVLTWPAPVSAGVVRVRAVAYRGRTVIAVSGVGRLIVTPRKGPAVVVSPKTQVLAASTVISASAYGDSGRLVYSGGNEVTVGQIIVVGQGPATPDGFLGQVTGVIFSGGQTLVQTKPATLMQAVRTGSFDEQLASVQASMDADARRAFKRAAQAALSCRGSAQASVTPTITFGASLDLKANWSWLHGLQSASLTAGAKASAGLTASVSAGGSCSLGPIPVVQFPGPSADFLVGPVPVVITSKVSVDLDASASVNGSLSTGISAGISASEGVGWTKNGGFYPIESFTPNFTHTPPTLSDDATVEADLTPKVDVLLYGVAGPQIALKAGLALSATTTSTPWWTLSAPVELDASLDAPVLDLQSPDLTLYKHSFLLAQANGAFNGGSGNGTVTVTNPGSQVGTVGTEVSLQITRPIATAGGFPTRRLVCRQG